MFTWAELYNAVYSPKDCIICAHGYYFQNAFNWLKQKPIDIIRWNEVALGAHENVLTSHILLKAGLSAIPHNDLCT